MPGKETVFISYRRSDSAAQAEQLRDQLAKEFHPETVFFDAGMPLGTDFPDEIAQAVARALAVLVVIGPGWLDSMKARAAGAAKTDWVFEEVKAALSRRASGDKLLVVPLLLAGTAMPEENQLPPALGTLWRLNADALDAQALAVPGNRALVDRLLQAGVRLYMDGDDQAMLKSLGEKVTALLARPHMAGIAANWEDIPNQPSLGTNIPKAITELRNAIRVVLDSGGLPNEPKDKAAVHGTCQSLLTLLFNMASDMALARQSRLSGGHWVVPAGQPGHAVNLLASELNAKAGGLHVPVLLQAQTQQHPVYANVIDTGTAGIGSDATANVQSAVWKHLQPTLQRDYPANPTQALTPGSDDFNDLKDAVEQAKWAHRPVLLAHAHPSTVPSPLPARNDAAQLGLDYLPYGPKGLPLTRSSMGLVETARRDCQTTINQILAP